MAATQEPEIQFAQRLASNEKPIRTKAIKKLRKYINVRSQKAAGGFTSDELLKLWKGLFYCLWMQDKPQLQEELSNQISTLIHSFHDIDRQMMYLESFLQTFKREWTGIDRLRMDKFFQLVRFMFRQTFEALKRKNWESSAVSKFLELLTAQLLQSSSEAPYGLQFHILELYMTELSAVGSAELTADQNLTFIEPFCKTAAKTKNRALFSNICTSIFSTIIDQAPFAIEDLMKELKTAEASDSDSGQASGDDDEDQGKGKAKSKSVSKKGVANQINGNKSSKEEDDDELLHLEDSDTELPCDEGIGPVLQFDYAALADKLFELASRNSTPGQNRQRLYKIIKVLRDISEGTFPQDEYPEEVSTDEDDDMFGSRKRMKRRGRVEDNENGPPAAKKSKGKKKETLNEHNKDGEPADIVDNDGKKKKKKKKKRKAGENVGRLEQGQTVAQAQGMITETEGGLECSQELEKEAQTHSSISSVKVTQAATPEGLSETLLLSETKKQPSVTVTEEASQAKPHTIDCKDQSKKKKNSDTCGPRPEVTATEEEKQTPATVELEMSCEAEAPVSGKRKRNRKKKQKKGLKAEVETDQTDAHIDILPIRCEVSGEETTTALPETDAASPAKKNKRGLKAKRQLKGESQLNGVNSETDDTPVQCEDSAEDGTQTGAEKLTDAAAPAKRKGKKKSLKADGAQKTGCTVPETLCEASQQTTTVPPKNMIKKESKQEVKVDQDQKETDQTLEEASVADESTVTPLKKKKKKNQKEPKTAVEEEEVVLENLKEADAEKLLFELTTTTPAKKKKKNLAAVQKNKVRDETLSQVSGSVDAELPLDEPEVVSSPVTPAKKKKRKIPVVFEYEADELQEPINGLAEEETVPKKTKLSTVSAEPSTPLSSKKSRKKVKTGQGSTSDFITFQSKAVVPTPLFCKTKGSPCTPLSKKKKSQTPKSDSKKVTFGLKNNKTAEFRKTDRSLLVSPDGSSRVPFDPQQKPKFGVLKSPPTPLSISIRKTPKSNKKTPKRRPLAADFF